MTETSSLRRVLLPIDASRDSESALEVAFDLAVALGGEVNGLFVEDAELLAAGRLPFAREVGSLSGIRRPITSTDMENRLQTVAHKARDMVLRATQRFKVRSSFQVSRGDVPSEILIAMTQADIAVLGRAGWSSASWRKTGRTCLRLPTLSPIPMFVVEHGARLAPPILAVDDGTAAGGRAVDFARELSGRLGWKFAVLKSSGMSRCDEVLRSIRQEKPSVLVVPSSLPLSESAPELKSVLLFVP
jgi:nucleotide-binding universal stress UspA family protein